jgi:hypothetical protein
VHPSNVIWITGTRRVLEWIVESDWQQVAPQQSVGRTRRRVIAMMIHAIVDDRDSGRIHAIALGGQPINRPIVQELVDIIRTANYMKKSASLTMTITIPLNHVKNTFDIVTMVIFASRRTVAWATAETHSDID